MGLWPDSCGQISAGFLPTGQVEPVPISSAQPGSDSTGRVLCTVTNPVAPALLHSDCGRHVRFQPGWRDGVSTPDAPARCAFCRNPNCGDMCSKCSREMQASQAQAAKAMAASAPQHPPQPIQQQADAAAASVPSPEQPALEATPAANLSTAASDPPAAPVPAASVAAEPTPVDAPAPPTPMVRQAPWTQPLKRHAAMTVVRLVRSPRCRPQPAKAAMAVYFRTL